MILCSLHDHFSVLLKAEALSDSGSETYYFQWHAFCCIEQSGACRPVVSAAPIALCLKGS